MRIAPLRTLASLAVVLSIGAAVTGAETGDPTVRIELDIFSGRPNPEWTLTAAQAAELEAMTASLTFAEAPPPPFDGLGYRGIVATDPERPGWSLVAFRDTVRLGTSEGTAVRADPGGTIERWLLDTSGGAVDSALISRILP